MENLWSLEKMNRSGSLMSLNISTQYVGTYVLCGEESFYGFCFYYYKFNK